MTSAAKGNAMRTDLQARAEAFRDLHRSGCFVMPNPWDAGSAKALAGLGFEALATSSGAAAGVLGRRDGEITRDEALAHARAIVEATGLPVSADLENGFGDAPADAALTIRLAGECGLAGASIEDCSGAAERRLYGFDQAVERIAAAAEAARALPFPFTLTARCENHLRGNPDWTTPSAACRPSTRPAPTCCSRRHCRIWRQCGRCVPPLPSRSISWSGARGRPSAWPNCARRGSAASAWPPRCTARPWPH
jgi:hypothetical protein